MVHHKQNNAPQPSADCSHVCDRFPEYAEYSSVSKFKDDQIFTAV